MCNAIHRLSLPDLGTLRWKPTLDQVGTQPVVVRVSDPRGGTATQSFMLTVNGANVAPVILSTPAVIAAYGLTYYYAVRAVDANRDPLTYSLAAGPAGMSIDAATGLLRYAPQAHGTFPVTVQASDGFGGVAQQSYSVVVPATTPDRPPVIESRPPLAARVGYAYSYQVDACDPDGDALTYAVSQTPVDGMQISASGLVSWTPSAAGTSDVVVTATDPAGKAAIQHFRLTATVNHPPHITSTAVTSEIAGRLYRYDARATDPDNDTLSWRLDSASVSRGMTVDAFGRITWVIPPKPHTAGPDMYSVTVTASDPYGEFDTQTYTLTITADTQAPTVQLQHEPTLRLNADPVDNGVVRGHFVVRASDNVRVDTLRLTVQGPGVNGPTTNVPLDRTGYGTLAFSAAGIYTVTAVAQDAAGNSTTVSDSLQVIGIANNLPPVVNITAPAAGATITAPTNVTGQISDPENGLVSWTLELVPFDGGPTRTLASGTAPVVTGRFKTGH